MQKILFIALVMFFNSAQSSAQYNHAVIYRQDKLGFDDELVRKYGYLRSMLLFNDTLSFYKFVGDEQEYKGSKTFGKKPAHHSIMYNLNRKLLVDVVNYQGKFLIKDESIQSWTFLNETKYILGYKCKTAIVVNEKSDTTKAWYAPELSRPFGPSKFRDLPGVILELQDQRFNQHILAVKVDTGNFKLGFPNEKIVTRTEFNRKKRYTHH